MWVCVFIAVFVEQLFPFLYDTGAAGKTNYTHVHPYIDRCGGVFSTLFETKFKMLLTKLLKHSIILLIVELVAF